MSKSRGAGCERYETPDGHRWRFHNEKISFSIGEVELRAIKRAYSDHDGKPASASEICEEYRLTPAEFQLIRRVRGWTHDSLPWLDEDIAAGDVDVDAHLASLKRGLKRDMASRATRETQQAAEKWWLFEESAREFVAGLELPTAEPRKVPRPSSPLAIWLMPTDLHVGVRAYEEGLGDCLSEDRLKVHAYGLLERGRTAGAECAIIVISGDGCHIDNYAGATTKGTPQDIADDPGRIAQRTLKAWVALVEHARLLGYRRVEVVNMPGNHDRMVAAMHGVAMELIYQSCDDVIVHGSNNPYKVWQWGRTGVLLCHGDGRDATRDLAQVFSVNFRKEWAESDYRYAVHGHKHHVQEEEGAGIRRFQLPSLAPTDAYHAMHWPVLTQPLCKALIFDKATGLRGTLESGCGWDPVNRRWAEV